AVALGALAAASTLTLAHAGGPSGPGGPVVIHDVQSSTMDFGTSITPPEQPNTEIEPSIAVNPGDPNNVVTVFQEGRVDAGGDRDNGFAASLDAGTTWKHGALPGLTTGAPNPQTVTAVCPAAIDPNPESFDRASDAVVTFGWDPTGKAHGGYIAYANSLVFDDSSCQGLPSGMAMNQSYDGGKNWTPAVFLEHDDLDGLNDKNWIVADNGTGTGHHHGRIYNFWDKVVYGLSYSFCDPDVAALASSDCSNPLFWSSPANEQSVSATVLPAIGVIPLVLTNGSVGLAFDDEHGAQPCTGTNPEDPSCLSAGTDIAWTVIPLAGQVTWSPSAVLPVANNWVDVAPYLSNTVSNQRAGSLPQAAVDPNTDEVYITWESNRFRDANHQNQNDAVVLYATDPGTGLPGLGASAWSSPVQVDPEAASSSVDDYNPTIAIGSDSILRVAYRSRYEPNGADLTGPGYAIDSYYQEAPTGATTSASFSSQLKIDTSKNTNDPQFGAFSRGGLFEGDYEQIAAGGADQSYFTRDEAWPATAGATCATGFSTPMNCQNQQTWVVEIAPLPSPVNTPEAPLAPALLLGGSIAAGAALAFRRRRITLTTS
ncbi:MAG: hypothetical protein JO222_11740, partial [Frankiales bacterium]|nr:hypothetical protein [Frankiales bacterium]